MRCPTLAELPPPPAGKSGWPWTAETRALPSYRPDGSVWPRLSIVTPSYNQGEFIEETIRSVLLQGYPNLEYIIMDGRSDDNSVDIIKKYEPWLASWSSEKDAGQADAINRGMANASGAYLNWLNSDDALLENCCAFVAEIAMLADTPWLISGVRLQFDREDRLFSVYGSCTEDWPLLYLRFP